jgi:hypothetical protein
VRSRQAFLLESHTQLAEMPFISQHAENLFVVFWSGQMQYLGGYPAWSTKQNSRFCDIGLGLFEKCDRSLPGSPVSQMSSFPTLHLPDARLFYASHCFFNRLNQLQYDVVHVATLFAHSMHTASLSCLDQTQDFGF